MFFMMGITTGRKDLNYDFMFICSRCGRYGRYNVYMTYMVLTLFFIPVFRWNRQYFAETRCCGATYYLDPEVGRRIEHGENIEIRPEDLTPANDYSRRQTREKRCMNCGFTTEEDYEFCPKCGQRF